MDAGSGIDADSQQYRAPASGSQRDSSPALDTPLHRLATYGSLAPGRPNQHQLEGLKGRWLAGHVCGRLVDAGWGADLGYPALILDPKGTAIPVHIFESLDLPEHWSRLDDFEGSGYQRVVTTVRTSAGDIEASIYVLRGAQEPGVLKSLKRDDTERRV
jgi:gamma-glutamylcyclotransferase (GGCT)/AIG2-like uncharacterized protein YtfP